jgi:hypothetical protein
MRQLARMYLIIFHSPFISKLALKILNLINLEITTISLKMILSTSESIKEKKLSNKKKLKMKMNRYHLNKAPKRKFK